MYSSLLYIGSSLIKPCRNKEKISGEKRIAMRERRYKLSHHLAPLCTEPFISHRAAQKLVKETRKQARKHKWVLISQLVFFV